MQQKHLYEYAVIRVVPVVEREEFVNAGVILFCKREKFIRMKYIICEEKIKALAPETDIDEIRNNLEGISKIVAGDTQSGPIAMLDAAERFRWLTAVRSATLQTSRPHPGVCEDLEATLSKLFADMVK